MNNVLRRFDKRLKNAEGNQWNGYKNPLITIVEEEIEEDKIHSIEDRLYSVQKDHIESQRKSWAYIAPI